MDEDGPKKLSSKAKGKARASDVDEVQSSVEGGKKRRRAAVDPFAGSSNPTSISLVLRSDYIYRVWGRDRHEIRKTEEKEKIDDQYRGRRWCQHAHHIATNLNPTLRQRKEREKEVKESFLKVVLTIAFLRAASRTVTPRTIYYSDTPTDKNGYRSAQIHL